MRFTSGFARLEQESALERLTQRGSWSSGSTNPKLNAWSRKGGVHDTPHSAHAATRLYTSVGPHLHVLVGPKR